MSQSSAAEIIAQANTMLGDAMIVHAIIDGFETNLAVATIAMAGADSIRLDVAESSSVYIIAVDRLIGVKGAPADSVKARVTGF